MWVALRQYVDPSYEPPSPTAFWQVPSEGVLRTRAKEIYAQHQAGVEACTATLRFLPQFVGEDPREILAARIGAARVREAVALSYQATDWPDLISMSRVLEHDDLTNLRYQAGFLVEDHKAHRKIAATRIRKSLPAFSNASDGSVFGAAFSRRDAEQVIAQELDFGSFGELADHLADIPQADNYMQSTGAFPERLEALRTAVTEGNIKATKELIEENPARIHARTPSDVTTGSTLLHRTVARAINWSRPATRGHLAVAQFLIDEGIDMDVLGGEGDACLCTPLDGAVWSAEKGIVRLLLKNGANPNRRFWAMSPPTATAAGHRGGEIFRMLVKAGAQYDVLNTVQLGLMRETRQLLRKNPAEASKRGVLQKACLANLATLDLLLAHGADPSLPDEDGLTPLMTAMGRGDPRMVASLVSAGAATDIFSAIGLGQVRIVRQMLAADRSLAGRGRSGQFPMTYAAVAGNREILDLLLDAGADPNPPQRGRDWVSSPLTGAIVMRQDHLVPRLIEAGAELHPASMPARWPLGGGLTLFTSRFGSREVLDTLLDNDLDPNHTGMGLNWPAHYGDMLGARQLLRRGLDQTTRENAMRFAAQNGQTGIIEQLGCLGTNPLAEHPEGNAIDQARAHGHTMAAALLEDIAHVLNLRAVDRDAILARRARFLDAALDDDGDALDAIIRQAPHLIDPPWIRERLLQYVSGQTQTREHIPLVASAEALARAGLEWDIGSATAAHQVDWVRRYLAQPDEGLHAEALVGAAKFGHLDIIQVALDAGVDVDARARRTTALHEAIRFHQLDAVRLLLDTGADISLRDGGGRTVLQSAWPQQARGRSELMAMLFEAGAG